MINVNFLFNSNKYYIDSFLGDLEHALSNIVFSSPDLLVYKKDDMEIMINNFGTVSFKPTLNDVDELNEAIPSVLQEYKELTKLSKRFSFEESFKVTFPKDITKEINHKLQGLNSKLVTIPNSDYNSIVIN